MKRYRISQKLFNKIAQAENTWKYLVEWFDPALGILHLDRVEFSDSHKRIYVYDAGINDHENSFFIEAKKLSSPYEVIKMTYEEAKNNIFASGVIPDGYYGDTMKVLFSFHVESGKTLCVHHDGFFTYQTPIAISKKEAFWLLEHHPSSSIRSLKLLFHDIECVCITCIADIDVFIDILDDEIS